jgi:hypothetical protein
MSLPRIVMAVYRCEIAGVPDESLDIQVRYFDDPNVDVESFLRDEPTHSYSNDRGELVTWPFVHVLAIQDLDSPGNGKEIVGFIAECKDLQKWAHK